MSAIPPFIRRGRKLEQYAQSPAFSDGLIVVSGKIAVLLTQTLFTLLPETVRRRLIRQEQS